MSALADRRVLIFGGSSGIGLSAARLGAETGAEVTVASRAPERLPVGRVGLLDDVGRAILFLMIDGFTTGSTLLVDGGGAIA